jgi:hypothetical protein
MAQEVMVLQARIDDAAKDADQLAAKHMALANQAAAVNEEELHNLAVHGAQLFRGLALKLRGEKWPDDHDL